MANDDTATWLGSIFTVYSPQVNWNAVAGLYIFAGRGLMGNWTALYVGQTESLAVRLSTHERWLEAARVGATHIHVRVEPLPMTRDAMEQQLIQTYQPRLNVQGKQRQPFLGA